MSRKSRYWQIVRYVRNNGPITVLHVAIAVGCSNAVAHKHSREARRRGLLKMIGKGDRGHFILAAVQTQDWPEKQQQRAA